MPNSKDNIDKNKKQQWKKRIDVFRYVYSCIKNPLELEECINTAKNDFNFEDNEIKVISYALSNFQDIKKKLIKYISGDWSWDRIKEILQAILVSAYAEFQVLKTPKKVIIDQAIINAKNYSDENDYKFINAILHKMLEV